MRWHWGMREAVSDPQDTMHSRQEADNTREDMIGLTQHSAHEHVLRHSGITPYRSERSQRTMQALTRLTSGTLALPRWPKSACAVSGKLLNILRANLKLSQLVSLVISILVDQRDP